jgi:hypothetical protein
MNCIHCGLNQPDGRIDCVRCGFTFINTDTGNPYEEIIENKKLDKNGLYCLLGGGFSALVILSMPFICFLITPLVTILHEFGHAITGWLFGYPSIPAFDFVYGGGVTMNTPRRMPLVFLIYLIFGFFIYRYRANRLSLLALLSMVLVYSICGFTRIHDFLIMSMGHGMELIIAGIFLYRAISNTSIVHAVERPLYAFLGLFIVFYDLRFAYWLISSASYRLQYGMAKGGGDWMDFSRVANEFMGGRLVMVSLSFLFCCFLPLPLSYLFFKFQGQIGNLFNRLLSIKES